MIACPLLEHKRFGLFGFVCLHLCVTNEFEGNNLLYFGLYVKVALLKNHPKVTHTSNSIIKQVKN